MRAGPFHSLLAVLLAVATLGCRDNSPRGVIVDAWWAQDSAALAKALPSSGTYTGALQFGRQLNRIVVSFTNGAGRGSLTRADCGSTPVSLAVDPAGNVTGQASLFWEMSCTPAPSTVTGRFEAGQLILAAETGARGGGIMKREFVLLPAGEDGSSQASP